MALSAEQRLNLNGIITRLVDAKREVFDPLDAVSLRTIVASQDLYPFVAEDKLLRKIVCADLYSSRSHLEVGNWIIRRLPDGEDGGFRIAISSKFKAVVPELYRLDFDKTGNPTALQKCHAKVYGWSDTFWGGLKMDWGFVVPRPDMSLFKKPQPRELSGT